jgi:cobyrinic acid a,c-diamide synthase
MPGLGPRLVVAGTHSGVGKTTVASGLMAAFSQRGLRVASAKVGPDFIDPGYHALATGRPGRNLDAWMCGPDAIGPLAGRAAHDADLLVVEGVMGMFDGADDASPSSTADVAALLDAPVLLVVDGGGMSQSIAALVHGFATYDERVRIAGVVCNRVGSPRHVELLRRALEPSGIPVLGALSHDDAFTWRDRHLGLVPVVERPEMVRDALDRLATAIVSVCDLDAIERVARRAPSRSVPDVVQPEPAGPARVAVASGRAFSFSYEDNLEALRAAGAELVSFDPCDDTTLPADCTGVIAGGGFPEVYGDALAANAPLLADVRRAVRAGAVIWAECGGLLWLGEQLDGKAMAGVVPATATMTSRLTLGYRDVHTAVRSPLGPAGTHLRGHEFHYSTVDPRRDDLVPTVPGAAAPAAWLEERVFASYLHCHLGAAPELATAFVGAAASARSSGRSR